MVKHIILWELDGSTSDEKAADAAQIKAALEGLNGVIPGLIGLKVYSKLLEGSNVELVLDSSFESREALEGYQKHPAHVKAATEVVRPRVKNRRCADYEV